MLGEFADLHASGTVKPGLEGMKASISSGWKSTMPNRLIIKDLLDLTKGRLMIMNTDNLFYDLDNRIPLAKKIDDARKTMKAADHKKFLDSFDNSDDHFMEYVVKIK